MANPAKNLLAILQSWRSEEPSSNFLSEENAFLSNITIDAVVQLKEIQHFIVSTKGTSNDLTYYMPQVDRWGTLIHRIGSKLDVSDDAVENAVFGLTTLIPQIQENNVASTEDEAKSLSGSLDELNDVINSDPTFPEPLKRYCFEIFASIRHDISQFEYFEEFDLQESIDRLIAATSHVARHYQGDKSMTKKLSRVFNGLLGIGKFSKASLESIDSGTNVFNALNSGL